MVRKARSLVKPNNKHDIDVAYLIKRIIKVGLPIGVQSVVVLLSNVVMQSHINGLGTESIAAWSIFARLETFIVLPIISFQMATITFVGQNYGAKKYHRIEDGVREGIKLSVMTSIIIAALLYIFPAFFISFFMFTVAYRTTALPLLSPRDLSVAVCKASAPVTCNTHTQLNQALPQAVSGCGCTDLVSHVDTHGGGS